jgi:lipid-A-disaccharide synthase
VNSDLLVVAGEASGDRAAAAVMGVLAQAARVGVVGMGGAAMEAAGAELVSDLRASTALGVSETAARAIAIAQAYRRVLYAARRTPVALLVNYTEFNARLAPRLHARGVRVLWYGAPQIWAWRQGRAAHIRRAIDRMAVILPFEEAIWRQHGVDAHYVGHPAWELSPVDRTEARRCLGLTERARAVAIMPGSRPHEVRRLITPMLEAYDRIRRDRASVDARVLVAPSLDGQTRAMVSRASHAARVPIFHVDARTGAGAILRAFDVALCASGTAALEAVLARAVPVIAYRVGLSTELLARALLRTPYLGLPNVILGRHAFAELVQRDTTSLKLAAAVAQALDGRDGLLAECARVEAALGGPSEPSRAVARMLAPWLGRALPVS